MAIAIERYLSVCKPTSGHDCKKILLPTSVAFAIIYNIPKFFELETVDVDASSSLYNENTTATGSHLENITDVNEKNDYVAEFQYETTIVEDLGYRGTPMRLNHWYTVLYVFWSKFIFVELVPWFTLIILNFCIWKKIKEFQRIRRTALRIEIGNIFKIKHTRRYI